MTAPAAPWPRWYRSIQTRPRVSDIARHAAVVFDVPEKQITGRARVRPVVRARQAVCLIARATGRTYPEIGRALNGRDHSTVIHSERLMKHLAARDPALAEKIMRVRIRVATDAPVPIKAKIVVRGRKDEILARFENGDDPAKIGRALKIKPESVWSSLRDIERIQPFRSKCRRPRNDFQPDAGEEADQSHQFHDGIAQGSSALLAAMVAERRAL